MRGRESMTLAAACALVASAMGPFAGATNSLESVKIDHIFTSAGLKSADIPGAAVLVLKHGQTVFARGYGARDLRTLHKIDIHTNFRLASVTKQFTAMAIMLLVHQRKLRYDERLTDIFPDFPDYGRAITIRMLLEHTSGLEDYEELMPQRNPQVPLEQIQIRDRGVLDLLKRQNSTKFPPGTRWAYSNSGYVLLGLIVATVSGESFPDFLRHRIFSPLRMTNTVAYIPGTNEVRNRAFGHSLENGVWKQTDQSPTSATLGDGGIYSSLDDLAKWDQALRDDTLLSHGEMEAAWAPVDAPAVEEADGTPAQYGFGWFLNAFRGHRRVWHYGETIGFRTAIQRFIDEGLTIVVLCNRADLNASALALQVADVYFEPAARK